MQPPSLRQMSGVGRSRGRSAPNEANPPLTARGAALFFLARGIVTGWPRRETRASRTLEPGRRGAAARNGTPMYGSCWVRPIIVGAMAKRAVTKAAKRKPAAKRELIAPRGDKRYIRRGAAGRIKESDDVSRSLSQDRRRRAKKAAKPGQRDRGDRKTASKGPARKKSRAKR